ncbi:winged helix-turn-helix transcriptional regulator [Bradyrhizobium japonicum]|uniref:winged helix-turn-helix transcriptional regulator n=1 Tax=Bradyrhizobium japonicum TaxID=375 RepID=UPI001BA6F026|nr:winged helix-turn-helix transcriptional regulator [Bradyrhizobium japonicum]MBR0766456.1 winged helix-turn-helix transcriptional regulator [Bradyrhizobium japonicum]
MMRKAERRRVVRAPSGTVQDLSVIVLMTLRDGPKRLSRLRREADGIPQRVLLQTLDRLEQEGSITEQRALTTPPTVKYQLTGSGRALLERTCFHRACASRRANRGDV